MDDRKRAFWAQFIFMFGFTKVIKLVGLFRKNPSDIIFLPVSIIFGYFHGLIKIHALCTLKMVRLPSIPRAPLCCLYNLLTRMQTSWGSRADGDRDDSVRLTRRPKRSMSLTTPPGKVDLIRYKDEKPASEKPSTPADPRPENDDEDHIDEKVDLLSDDAPQRTGA